MALASLLLLTACGTSQVTSQSSGAWEQVLLVFADAIKFLSFGGSTAIGIILFTLLVRLLMTPLYNMQLKSSREMQDLQPELRALQRQYPGRDTESRLKLTEATNALYKEHGVNPYASFIPLLIQLPILMALYQALTRVDFLQTGSFLWVNLADKDPYYILPILAAVFTFLSTWLTNKGAREKNAMMTAMTVITPLMILLIGINIASGVAIYWTVSNAYQVAQIMIFNNPFKIIAERQAIEAQEKERQAKMRRAKRKAHKRK
nr:YidC/Oxa1 family membrane protein insertase [Streptococcus loxodontisalivarius]